jgi:hypothetical protein
VKIDPCRYSAPLDVLTLVCNVNTLAAGAIDHAAPDKKTQYGST